MFVIVEICIYVGVMIVLLCFAWAVFFMFIVTIMLL